MSHISFKVFKKISLYNCKKISSEVIITEEHCSIKEKKVNFSEIYQLTDIFLAFRISIIGFFLK